MSNSKSPLAPKVLVALDDMDMAQAMDFLDRSRGAFAHVKIGLELYYKLGPDFVRRVHGDYGLGVFLDLKLHDIPNTVRKAIRSLKNLPATFLTVHLGGGREMLNAAVEETFVSIPGCTLLGVSVLTSLGESDLMELWGTPIGRKQEVFERLFNLGLSCKVPGMVLSAHELKLLQDCEAKSSREVIKVCPGIRFQDEIASGLIQDQKRVLSPQAAWQAGADYVVMGRSLTQLTKVELERRLRELA